MRGIPIAGPCPECEEWCMILCRRCPECGLAWPRLRPNWILVGALLFVAVFIGLGVMSGTFTFRRA